MVRPDAPKPDFAPAFLRGVAHFNARRFWEAHEAWEELWLAAESDLVEFLQGLIQLAAAYHHVQRGTLRGAVRLFDAALRRLERFPEQLCGVERSAAEGAAGRHRRWAEQQLSAAVVEPLSGGDYPQLTLVSTEEEIAPPRQRW